MATPHAWISLPELREQRSRAQSKGVCLELLGGPWHRANTCGICSANAEALLQWLFAVSPSLALQTGARSLN